VIVPHRPPFSLRQLKLEVTHSCPLNCLHCSSDASAQCTREMTAANCKRILGEAIALGITEVAFSGGEPLIWPSLEEIIGNVQPAKLQVHIYTSGNVPDVARRMSNLRRLGVESRQRPSSSQSSSNGGMDQKWKIYNGIGTMLFLGGWLYDIYFTPSAVARRNSGIKSERATAFELPPRVRRFFWDPEQTSVSVPGCTLSAFFNGAFPLRKDIVQGARIEGGPEIRIRRLFLSMIWYKERSSDFINPNHYEGDFYTTVESTSVGVAITKISEVLLIASVGKQGLVFPFSQYSAFGGERYAIEARHASLGVEVSYWHLRKTESSQSAPSYVALALKYRLEPFVP